MLKLGTDATSINDLIICTSRHKQARVGDWVIAPLFILSLSKHQLPLMITDVRRTILLGTFGLIFGMLTAYLSIQIFNSMDVDGEHPKSHWYDGLMVTLIPSAIINLPLRLDLSNASEAYIDRGNDLPIMILNGVGWLMATLALRGLYLLFSLVYRRSVVPIMASIHAR